MRARLKGFVVYPGSFDPITMGHLDIIRRARAIFGQVMVAVSSDTNKNTHFSAEQRLRLVRGSLREGAMGQGVKAELFAGLLTDYLRKIGARVVIRGLRFISDFEYELQMALMNRKLHPEIETVYLMPDEKHLYLSSSIVKEIAQLGKSARAFVPACVARLLASKGRQGIIGPIRS